MLGGLAGREQHARDGCVAPIAFAQNLKFEFSDLLQNRSPRIFRKSLRSIARDRAA